MTSCMERNIQFLQLLTETSESQREALLKTATPSQIRALAEVIKNILNQKIPCGENQEEIEDFKRKGEILKSRLRKIADTEKSYRKKKRAIQKGGGAVVDLILPVLSGFLSNLF